jgi:hypothetical protein
MLINVYLLKKLYSNGKFVSKNAGLTWKEEQ